MINYLRLESDSSYSFKEIVLCKHAILGLIFNRLDFKIQKWIKKKKKSQTGLPVSLQQADLPQLVAMYSSGRNIENFKQVH